MHNYISIYTHALLVLPRWYLKTSNFGRGTCEERTDVDCLTFEPRDGGWWKTWSCISEYIRIYEIINIHKYVYIYVVDDASYLYIYIQYIYIFYNLQICFTNFCHLLQTSCQTHSRRPLMQFLWSPPGLKAWDCSPRAKGHWNTAEAPLEESPALSIGPSFWPLVPKSNQDPGTSAGPKMPCIAFTGFGAHV